MTYITQVAPLWKKSVLVSRTMVLTCFVWLLVQPSTVHAQWATNGNNINNTNSGNVGVGTTAPATSLHVATESVGTRGITNSQHSADNNGALFIFRKSKGTILSPLAAANGDNIGNLYAEGYDGTSWISGGRIRFAIDGPVSAGVVPTSVQFFSGNNNFGGVERMRISSAGNVGIGTTSPSFTLDVQGGANNPFRVQDSAAREYFSTSTRTGTYATVPVVNLAGTRLIVDHDSPEGGNSTVIRHGVNSLIFNPSDHPTYPGQFLVRQVGGGVGLSVDQWGNGSVGIGTSTPTTKLDVAGQIRSSSGGFKFPDGTVQTTAAVGGSSQWTTSGTNVYYNSGNVGIGTTTPGSKLDVGVGSAPRGAYTDLLVGAGGNNAQIELFGPTKSAAITNDEALNGVVLYTNGPSFNPAFFASNSGSIGIGTTSPGEFVHIRKDQNAPTHLMVENSAAGALAYADLQVKNNLGHFAQLGIYSSSTTTAGALAPGNAFAYTSSPAMVIMANNAAGVIKFAPGGVNERARIDASGNLGIGTTTPSEKLEVVGNLKLTGTGNIDAAGTITGGTIVAKYQDVAEWVQSSQALAAGTVVVLDHTKSNQVIASSQAYDTRVAGVISLQPGITLGEKGEAKVLVATTGRVRIKVDATQAPIQVGDLLVTGDREGFAMKSLPVDIGGVQLHRPGTLVGKALEPLASGTGEILVLLSLQ